MARLTKNAIRCLKCSNVIESTHVHDFRWCPCKAVFIDGGLEYQRIGGSKEDWQDLSEYDGKPTRQVAPIVAHKAPALHPDTMPGSLPEVVPEDEDPRDLGLTWGANARGGQGHMEWHAPCGCAYHPEGQQGPHVHPCKAHARDDSRA